MDSRLSSGLLYAAGSTPKREQPMMSSPSSVQPAGGNSAVPSPKPPSASTSNNAPGGGGAAGSAPPPAFDLNADPVLQQVQAQMAASNQQAEAGALSQEEQALLQLGDPALAKSILGGTDPMLAAIGNNPESQYAQLHRQYQQELQQFGETIDPSLVDSGYRVQQEGNMSQSLQDALAQAAAGFQNQYQSIRDALAQTEAQNADTLSQAWSDAYTRALQQALTNPAGSSTSTGGGSGTSSSKPRPHHHRHLARAAGGGGIQRTY